MTPGQRPTLWIAVCAGALATAASFQIATSALAEEKCRPLQLASLPLSTEPDGSVSISATVNSRTVPLLVDTGGNLGMLDAASAKDLGLDISRSRSSVSLPGGLSTSQFAEVDAFQLDGLLPFQSKFAVIPADANNSKTVRNIGADALSRYNIEIDFVERELNLYAPEPCNGLVIQWNGISSVAVPMDLDRDYHIFVQVVLDGHPLTALLDTGAQRTIMSLKTAHDIFGVSDAGLLPEAPASLNGAAPLPAFRYPFKSLSVAGIAISSPNIQLLPEDVFGGDSPQLLLGVDLLRHFHIYIDYAGRYLYIAEYPGR